MLKIYLDQKDYSQIASGLLGESGYLEYRDVYEYLLTQIELGNIRIYYSSIHLEELTDYFKEGSAWLDKCIEVIKNLSNDNCMISYPDLIKREIHSFLSDTLSFECPYSNTEYPYGVKSEAVFGDIPLNYTLARPYNRSQRKNMCKRLSRMSMSQLSDKFPGSDKMNKSDFIDIHAGSYTDPNRIKNMRTYLNILLEIEGYLKIYRNSGIVKGLIEESKHSSDFLLDIIEKNREVRQKKGEPGINDMDIRLSFIKIIEEKDGSLWPFLDELCNNNDIDLKEAVMQIKDNLNDRLYSLECTILIYTEYFNKHKDYRKPHANDYHDLKHMRFLPYVDFYVCDKFFAELSKRVAPNFNTKVFRNIKELREHLEEVL